MCDSCARSQVEVAAASRTMSVPSKSYVLEQLGTVAPAFEDQQNRRLRKQLLGGQGPDTSGCQIAAIAIGWDSSNPDFLKLPCLPFLFMICL